MDETIDSFTYLGASNSSDGEIKDEVVCRIAKACRAEWCFLGYQYTRQWFCQSCCMELRPEALKTEQVKHLSSFHKSIFGVTRYQQWEEQLSSKTLSSAFGMQWFFPFSPSLSPFSHSLPSSSFLLPLLPSPLSFPPSSLLSFSLSILLFPFSPKLS